VGAGGEKVFKGSLHQNFNLTDIIGFKINAYYCGIYVASVQYAAYSVCA
jgi:hypothetical protein